MKTWRCSRCNEKALITNEKVEKKWFVKGYKYEYWAYFLKCPKCGEEEETSFFKLPFKVKWQIIKESLNAR